MSEKSFILLEDINSSQAVTELVVEAAVSPSPFNALEETFAVERGKRSPVGCPMRPAQDVCETEAGTEADVEDKDVNIVAGFEDAGVSGYESEGFTLSETLLRKRLSQRRVSEGAVDPSQLPQCQLPKFRRLPLTFPLELLCWPVIEFN